VNSTPAIAASQYNGFNQLLAVSGPSGTTSFAYDGNGNQVSRTDGLGTTTYAYSYDNRLVGISGPAGSSYFEYDANGLRTKKADSTGTRSYLLDGLSVVAEYAPDASNLAWYTQSLARIDEVLSVVNGQGKYWYEADALGSTYAMTNAAGAVVSRSSYDVFGERTLVSANDVAQPFGFTGREHDGSGLVYARARYMGPSAGGFISPDIDPESVSRSGGVRAETGIWKSFGGGVPWVSPAFGRYAYAEANAALNRDPTGFALEIVNRGSVIYTGFAASTPWWPGSAGALGAAYGFFGGGGTFGGMSSAVAVTYGVAVHGSLRIGFSMAVEFGVYWGLVDACDYAGPFASLGFDLGAFGSWGDGLGFAPVFSVKLSKIEAARTYEELLAAFDGPVGFSLSAGSPRLTGKVVDSMEGVVGNSRITAAYTYSELYSVWGCTCRN
jgi:RHS repeat-associated protein